MARSIRIKLRIRTHNFLTLEAREALEHLDPFQGQECAAAWCERRNILAGIVTRAGSTLN